MQSPPQTIYQGDHMLKPYGLDGHKLTQSIPEIPSISFNWAATVLHSVFPAGTYNCHRPSNRTTMRSINHVQCGCIVHKRSRKRSQQSINQHAIDQRRAAYPNTIHEDNQSANNQQRPHTTTTTSIPNHTVLMTTAPTHEISMRACIALKACHTQSMHPGLKHAPFYRSKTERISHKE